MTVSRLLHGIVVETTAKSYTGPYLYSDFAVSHGEVMKNSMLNNLTQIPLIGSIAGVFRVALGIIHTLGHLFAALKQGTRMGHLYHAAKGVAEIIRGAIEAIPIVGRIFSWCYMPPLQDGRCWWMIKMYDPTDPDGLDLQEDQWDFFRQDLPQFYVHA